MSLALLGVTASLFGGFEGFAPVNAVVGRALTPVDAAASKTADVIAGIAAGARDARRLRQRVKQLEADLANLEVTSAKFGELMRENDRLRGLAGFREQRVDLDLIGASVRADAIAVEPGDLMHSMWVDAGTDDGVAVGDPVAVEHGLVGRVVRAYRGSSQVRQITDPSARVGVRIERSWASGMLVGSPSGELTMRYIPQDDPSREPNVVVGDLVFTSGLAGEANFPRMLPVGQVIEVRRSDERTAQEAVVRPHVDLGSLELVLVIVGWDPDPLGPQTDGDDGGPEATRPDGLRSPGSGGRALRVAAALSAGSARSPWRAGARGAAVASIAAIAAIAGFDGS